VSPTRNPEERGGDRRERRREERERREERGERQVLRAHLVFLGLVGGGYVSQILDHLLGVFSFTCTRLSSEDGEIDGETDMREKDTDMTERRTYERENTQIKHIYLLQ